MKIPNLDKLFSRSSPTGKPRKKATRGRPARFSLEDVASIRRKHKQGATVAYLSRSFYTSEPTIRDIIFMRGAYKETDAERVARLKERIPTP